MKLRFAICIFFLVIQLGCQTKQLERKTTATQPQHIVMTNQFRRVVHYDCHGKIVKDSVEKIADANQILDLDIAGEPKEIKVFNASTNSRAGCFIDNKYFRISEKSDTCGMEIKPGINELHYGVFYCEGENCDESQKESGTIYLNVSINQEHIGGIDAIQPNCSDKKDISSDEEKLLQLSRQFLEDYPLSFSLD